MEHSFPRVLSEPDALVIVASTFEAARHEVRRAQAPLVVVLLPAPADVPDEARSVARGFAKSGRRLALLAVTGSLTDLAALDWRAELAKLDAPAAVEAPEPAAPKKRRRKAGAAPEAETAPEPAPEPAPDADALGDPEVDAVGVPAGAEGA